MAHYDLESGTIDLKNIEGGNVGHEDSVRPNEENQYGLTQEAVMETLYLDDGDMSDRHGEYMSNSSPYRSKKRNRLVLWTLIIAGIALMAALIGRARGKGDPSGQPGASPIVGDLQEVMASLAREEQEILEQMDEMETEEQKELLNRELGVLAQLEDAVSREQQILEQMDRAKTEEEKDLLDEEAAVAELIQNNLRGQADLLHQAAHTETNEERQRLVEEVEQVMLQGEILEHELEFDVEEGAFYEHV